nr:MAG TPA: hypothetical protein [Caudoviricetes sp.]
MHRGIPSNSTYYQSYKINPLLNRTSKANYMFFRQPLIDNNKSSRFFIFLILTLLNLVSSK